MDVQLFRIRFDAEHLIAGLLAGIGRKECDQEPARIDVARRRERVSGDRVSHFGRGANDDVGAKAEAPLDAALDALDERNEIRFVCFENYVAALEVGAGIFQAEGDVEITERIHFDSAVRTQIDASEHGDDGRHITSAYDGGLGAVGGPPDSRLRFLCGEMPGIYLHEIPPPIGNIIEGENRGDGAHWHTCSAINALHRIDVELGLRFEIHFVFFRVNAIDRARINARSIFHVDARLGNHVGHEDSPTSSLKGASWQKP